MLAEVSEAIGSSSDGWDAALKAATLVAVCPTALLAVV